MDINKDCEIDKKSQLITLESILEEYNFKDYGELVRLLYKVANLTNRADFMESIVEILDEIDDEYSNEDTNSCEIGNIRNNIVNKEYYVQGHIYKNYENFKNKKGICYVSEFQGNLHVGKYNDIGGEIPKVNLLTAVEGEDYETYDTIKTDCIQALNDNGLELTEEQIEIFVGTVFEDCDWQSIYTLANEYAECWED